eukprot:c24631_g1_i1.p1 GENE.c24631_g1_i1~~c24631_g1_i1.p1  ORF type:complete len:209 (+),score=38.87 c24631_g1_i1:60-629(+)
MWELILVALFVFLIARRLFGKPADVARPARPTPLPQLLKSLPSVSISTNNILVEHQGTGPIWRAIESGVEAVKLVSKKTDVFLITLVASDEDEAAVLRALENAGMFDQGNVDKIKCVFCSTVPGRSSIVRQLEPHIHIDTDIDLVVGLSPHIRKMVLIGETSRTLAPNVLLTSDLPSLAITPPFAALLK